ncbi:MAG: ABC transporter permease [Acidobacteria bacterium]|nr:ABC transporter permease [Acidobacteriota bacterium]
MSIILKIAWRNLWRKPRRTVLTVVTIALGLALLLVFLGLGDGGHYQMIEAAVRMGSGHVLVQHKEYHAKGGIDRFLDPTERQRAEEWAREMEQLFPIQHVLRRTYASGLASSSDGSVGVQMIGIEPEAEREASQFDEKLTEGEFLDSTSRNEVVLGEGVAHRLALEVGEKLVLMVQGAGSAEIQSQLVRVKGILRTGLEESDQALVLLPLATSQDFLNLGEGIHQLALLMNDSRPSTQVASMGKERLPSLEVLSWSEAMPELVDFIRIDEGGNYIMNMVLFLLIAFTVLNTLLMSVLERGREFALLHSLGLTPIKRFFMVLFEATFMAALSVLVGFSIGYGFHLYLKFHGLPLDLFYSGELSAVGVMFDPVVYSDLSAVRVLSSLGLVFILTLTLALVPACRAARSGDVHLLGRA